MSEQVNAVANGYVYLKNISGTVIKPITDLSAINMTTTNGIAVEQVNGGTIGIRDGYIESCYYAEMVDPGVGPGNVDSAYIEGGTMFTLIGGYTVTDEIPPAYGASHERVPSEYSVRSAIDALATLGPALTPGAGIQIETVPGQSGGILSVAEGNGINVNTAQTGGVSVKAGAGISVDSNGVSVVTATNNTFGGIAGATNGVQLVDGVAQFDNDTVDAAEYTDIFGYATHKVITADILKASLNASSKSLYKIPDRLLQSNTTTGYTFSYDDGVWHLACTVSSAKNAGIYFTGIASYMRTGRKYLISCDYKVTSPATAGVISVDRSSDSPTYTSNTPKYARRSTVVGEWQKLAVVASYDTLPSYVGFQSASAAGDVIDIYLRNIVLFDVTDIPSQFWDIFLDGAGYLYESGAGTIVNGCKIDVDEASPAETLAGVSDKTVTPNSLISTMGLGLAVDLSSNPFWSESTETDKTITDYDKDTPFVITGGTVGFYNTGDQKFPKYGANRSYLYIADVVGTGVVTPQGGTGVTLNNTSTPQRVFVKAAAGAGSGKGYFVVSGDDASVTFSNFRQYATTSMSDDAIAYLCDRTALPNPDTVFQAATTNAANQRYLIKPAAVAPWTYYIPIDGDAALASGSAYNIDARTGTHKISVSSFPTDAHGQDTHIKLFVGDTASVTFESPLVLMNPLTANAGHNITVKWRGGQALAYVDDTDIGYVVSVTAGTAVGTLWDGLVNTTDTYIVFNTSTDGIPVSLSETVGTLDRSIVLVGNGIDNTIINAEYGIPTSANITASRLTVTGKKLFGYSVMTLNNVVMQNATAGETYSYWIDCKAGSSITSCLFDHITVPDPDYAVVYARAGATITGCTFSNLSATRGVMGYNAQWIYITDCVFNNTTVYDAIYATGKSGNYDHSKYQISGSTFSAGNNFNSRRVNNDIVFTGYNKFSASCGNIGRYLLADGSVFDLSENENKRVIHLGDGSTISAVGTAAVIPFGGTEPISVSGTGRYLLNNGKLGYLVSDPAATTDVNTLYDALVGGGTPYSNVIFDPTVSGTFSLAGSTVGRLVNIYGNDRDATSVNLGVNLTTLANPSVVATADLDVRDMTITGGTVYRTTASFTNCVVKDITYDSVKDEDSASNDKGLFTIGATGITGSTFSGFSASIAPNRAALATTANPTSGPIKNSTFIIPNTWRGSFVYLINYTNDTTKCTVSNCYFENNTYTSSGASINVYRTNTTYRWYIKDCVFTGSKPGLNLMGPTGSSLYGAKVELSGNTFSAPISGGSYAELYFADTNVIDTTVSGAMTLCFLDGATVTSTIPEGSTIGTGVISCPIDQIKAAGITLKDISISGATYTTAGRRLLEFYTDGVVKQSYLTNVSITNVYLPQAAAGIFVGSGKTVTLTDVTITGNTNVGGIIAYNGGVAKLNGVYTNIGTSIGADGRLVHMANADNTIGAMGLMSGAASGLIIFEPGSITRTTNTSFTCQGTLSMVVGNYDAETGTASPDGTATVVLAGTTVSISGSGTILDSTGLHS